MAVSSKSEARRDQIQRAAEKVFARSGFQESTISDIAKEAGLSDATIYEYFASKEELLFSIPGELTLEEKEFLEFHLAHVRGAGNKLRSLIYHYLWFWQSHPDYASVAMLILKQNRKFVDTEAYRIIQETYRMIPDIIRDGIASGEFDPSIRIGVATSMVLGAIEHMVVHRLLHGKPDDLLDYVDYLTDTVLRGIQKQDSAKDVTVHVTVNADGSHSVK
ncbi:MAG TPA: TetR/AcrR family transcriptional regulator [Spirochaetota bacterium]|nr:TetR/AcrR family transcriptional regulator [Spirochaetota bacterium]